MMLSALGVAGACLSLAAAADAHRGDVARGRTCEGGQLVRTQVAPRHCTHGEDPAPPGLDADRRRSLAELRRDVPSRRIGCQGDGVSGPRVEAIYAVASDRTDRYASVAPLIAGWAGEVEDRFDESAAQTSDARTVRFRRSGCDLVVRHEILSPAGDDSIGSMADELWARGYDRSDRRYLVWVDAEVYCGMGYVDWLYARVDAGCWGVDGSSAEVHELVHTLGGVDPASPHGTNGWHCTDEWDVMCYSDEPDYPEMSFPCGAEQSSLLDCGDDDYFNTAPAAWTWLGQRPWRNVAESAFLGAADGEPVTYLPDVPAGYAGPRYRLITDNVDDDLCAEAAGVRLFCTRYLGGREQDITGALLALADDQAGVELTLRASNRGGPYAFGVRLLRDDEQILDERDGEVGGASSSLPESAPDPSTGWRTFFERAVTISFNAPPIAVVGATPGAPVAGQAVTFESFSYDDDGTIQSYDWDLADGSNSTVAGSSATTTFGTAGTRTVRLTVTDDRGATDTVSTEVVVAPAPDSGTEGANPTGTTSSTTSGGGGGSTAVTTRPPTGPSPVVVTDPVPPREGPVAPTGSACRRAQARVASLRRAKRALVRRRARAGTPRIRRSLGRRIGIKRRALASAKRAAAAAC